MKDVTIICCYNNLNQYKKFLDSLSGQSMEVELIGIDNSKKAFQSCAAAFNTNICNVETPYIIFSHQDIEFVDENNILDFVNSIKKVALYDIVGVAGRLVQGGTVVSNIVQGEAKQYAGKQRLSNITECDVIDECFFGGYTENFKQYPFDEDLCNNWHLYALS